MSRVSRFAARAVITAVALACIQTAASATPPDAEAFARYPAIASVTLSPDGRRLAAITSPDGQSRYLAIWRTDALNETPTVVGSDDRLTVVGVQFVSNDRLAVTTRQNFEVGSFRGHLFKGTLSDLQGNQRPILRAERATSEAVRWQQQVSTPSILSTLPNDPEHILVLNTYPGGGDIYRVHLASGRQERIQRPSDRFGGYQADLHGELRARQELGFESGNVFLAQWLRHPDTGAWEEHFRSYARDREPVNVAGFTTDPDIVFVVTSRGRENAAIFEYSIRRREMLESAFEHAFFDATGVIQSTAPGESYGELLGVRYAGPASEVYWLHPRLDGIQAAIENALNIQYTEFMWTGIADGRRGLIEHPVDAAISIVDFSNDMNTVILVASGPRTPPTYLLFRDGHPLQVLGRAYPEITPGTLGSARLVQYQARDGLTIPGILTTPPADVYGEGPHPAIVLPHGGPWGRDSLSWNSSGWTQYFAARGYAVLQPQFRGSDGWGQRLWRAGDGEWGGAMQDDMDDGARWMIEQGVADPDRIAMHGFSYGGYSAMAAAIRPNGLYQCAIAGAGVASIQFAQRGTYSNRFLREFQRPTVAGLSPVDRAAEASIPVFLYHGDRDNVVPITESENFEAALRRAGHPVEFLRVPDMAHGYSEPRHGVTVLEAIDAFLREGCGPGGL